MYYQSHLHFLTLDCSSALLSHFYIFQRLWQIWIIYLGQMWNSSFGLGPDISGISSFGRETHAGPLQEPTGYCVPDSDKLTNWQVTRPAHQQRKSAHFALLSFLDIMTQTSNDSTCISAPSVPRCAIADQHQTHSFTVHSVDASIDVFFYEWSW